MATLRSLDAEFVYRAPSRYSRWSCLIITVAQFVGQAKVNTRQQLIVKANKYFMRVSSQDYYIILNAQFIYAVA